MPPSCFLVVAELPIEAHSLECGAIVWRCSPSVCATTSSLAKLVQSLKGSCMCVFSFLPQVFQGDFFFKK